MTNPRELAAEKPPARERTVARPDLSTPHMMLVDPRFGELAGQFFRLFGQPSDGGGALALYLHGEPVVDIWSGWAAREPLGKDRLSTAKRRRPTGRCRERVTHITDQQDDPHDQQPPEKRHTGEHQCIPPTAEIIVVHHGAASYGLFGGVCPGRPAVLPVSNRARGGSQGLSAVSGGFAPAESARRIRRCIQVMAVAYLHGEPVVDIWSGWAARDTRWQSDTVSVSFSTGKGVASTVLHRAGGPRTDRLRRPSPRIGPSSRVPARSW